MTRDPSMTMDQTQRLAEHLKRVTRVVQAGKLRPDGSVDAEAWQIATALSDVEESANKIFSELLPNLLSLAPESDAANDLLHEVGEEYRHILYHILDTKIFSYIVPEPEPEADR